MPGHEVTLSVSSQSDVSSDLLVKYERKLDKTNDFLHTVLHQGCETAVDIVGSKVRRYLSCLPGGFVQLPWPY